MIEVLGLELSMNLALALLLLAFLQRFSQQGTKIRFAIVKIYSPNATAGIRSRVSRAATH